MAAPTSMVQSIIPVQTVDGRILGTAALDTQTTFNGSETSVVIATKTIAISLVVTRRARDQAPIAYMAAVFTLAQERNEEHRNIPAFGEVSANTSVQGWRVPGSVVMQPTVDQSTWEQFLIKCKVQNENVLPALPAYANDD